MKSENEIEEIESLEKPWAGEFSNREPKLVCTECGKPAQGNASWTDGTGEICDTCVTLDEQV